MRSLRIAWPWHRRQTRETPYRNLYHCCTHKSASQWFRIVFNDGRVRRATGMKMYHYHSHMKGKRDSRPLWERTFDEPFPDKTIPVCLYMTYPAFKHIPKPEPYRGFFVMRDPRDLAVSWYYSLKYSHPVLAGTLVVEKRELLHEMSVEEGLIYAINDLNRRHGIYQMQRTWAEDLVDDEAIRLFRYEDLFGDREHEAVRRLFDHLGIEMSDEEFAGLLDDYSFAKLSGGRAKGQSDNQHHYRRGAAGGWKDEFTPRAQEAFAEVTGDLLRLLGYESA